MLIPICCSAYGGSDEYISAMVCYIVLLFSNYSVLLLSCSYLEMELVEQDQDFTALSLQFKATAMELISVLEQVKVELVFGFKMMH